MKLKIVFFVLFILVSSPYSLLQKLVLKDKAQSSYFAHAEYSYVEVFEDGVWWMYVYDGTVLIDRYILEN